MARGSKRLRGPRVRGRSHACLSLMLGLRDQVHEGDTGLGSILARVPLAADVAGVAVRGIQADGLLGDHAGMRAVPARFPASNDPVLLELMLCGEGSRLPALPSEKNMKLASRPIASCNLWSSSSRPRCWIALTGFLSSCVSFRAFLMLARSGKSSFTSFGFRNGNSRACSAVGRAPPHEDGLHELGRRLLEGDPAVPRFLRLPEAGLGNAGEDRLFHRRGRDLLRHVGEVAEDHEI
eukprot:CAMPEP_0175267466 /NCGR_PEP_ID=MMETSP0093-20121207/43855_1 /TAXON_ID=311494 /ORGANISM="Alexandrium monilatum, Strain CCMP3105" /LENGTH=236 /DNA_ID=CAMNT_0016562087 /DNA_START=55 /DNA_END=763 /DNA_ORIENTATION=+